MKHWISLTFFCVSHGFIALVLTETARTPSGLIMNPKYSLCVSWKSHLFGLTFLPAGHFVLIRFLTSFSSCVKSFEYITMSSRYTRSHISRYLWRAELIHLYQVVGALLNPNGKTVYSNSQYRISKAVFHSSTSLIQILLYVALMSSLV